MLFKKITFQTLNFRQIQKLAGALAPIRSRDVLDFCHWMWRSLSRHVVLELRRGVWSGEIGYMKRKRKIDGEQSAEDE